MFREANDMLLAMVNLPPVPADTNDPERELSADELREANARLRGSRHTRIAPRRGKIAPAPVAPAKRGRTPVKKAQTAAHSRTVVHAKPNRPAPPRRRHR